MGLKANTQQESSLIIIFFAGCHLACPFTH